MCLVVLDEQTKRLLFVAIELRNEIYFFCVKRELQFMGRTFPSMFRGTPCSTTHECVTSRPLGPVSRDTHHNNIAVPVPHAHILTLSDTESSVFGKIK